MRINYAIFRRFHIDFFLKKTYTTSHWSWRYFRKYCHVWCFIRAETHLGVLQAKSGIIETRIAGQNTCLDSATRLPFLFHAPRISNADTESFFLSTSCNKHLQYIYVIDTNNMCLSKTLALYRTVSKVKILLYFFQCTYKFFTFSHIHQLICIKLF